MAFRNIRPVEVESFIRRELRGKLERDLRVLNIVKEADLECCAYYFLRRYLRRDPSWQILAHRHSKRTGHYLDLLIFRKLKPRIAIEFKWNPRSISEKDRGSLRKAIKKLQVNKAYFVCAVRSTADFEKIAEKTKTEQYRLHEVLVGLDFSPDKRKSWESKRNVLYNPRPRKSPAKAFRG